MKWESNILLFVLFSIKNIYSIDITLKYVFLIGIMNGAKLLKGKEGEKFVFKRLKKGVRYF